MGGATFPAHVKLTIPRDKKIDAFVVNGVECEPYLTADYRVMMERADEALQGALICAKATRAPRVIIGVELNKKDAIEHLKAVVEETDSQNRGRKPQHNQARLPRQQFNNGKW